MITVKMNLSDRGYDIVVGKGLLDEVNKYFNLERKVFIVTDSGVPSEYALAVKGGCDDRMIFTVESGEGSKSITTLASLLNEMSLFGMGRTDAVVAVGGGVVGDLAGFAAAIYMRGVDFYNIPTTVLSQVDSSIGGKTAINLGGIKNNVGAFHQPKGVLIDTDTIATLPPRQISAGLAEAVKMAVTSDKELFEMLEKMTYDEIIENIDKVIVRSLNVKKSVVEEDERETGLRRILNFGHTYGHAIEAKEELGGLYHGECVAIGMIPMCEEKVASRVKSVLKKLSLPTEYEGDVQSILDLIGHDKKRAGDKISVILSEEIGSFEIKKMTVLEIGELINTARYNGWRK